MAYKFDVLISANGLNLMSRLKRIWMCFH